MQAATESTTAKLRNQIARNAPEINWEYAVIQRLNPQDLTTRLIPFNLGKLVLQGDEQNNLALEPGDVITIFSQNDLAVPLEKRSKFVRLEGEFQTAGVYQAEPGETLRHLVERTGAFTGNAYLYGAVFTRESVRLEQQKGLDQMVEKLEEDISRNALSPAGAISEDPSEKRAQLEAQRELVDKLREVKATGRVVLDLTPNSAGVKDLPEIALEDGDRFVVPYRPATVEMLGALYNKNFFSLPAGRAGGGLSQTSGRADPRRRPQPHVRDPRRRIGAQQAVGEGLVEWRLRLAAAHAGRRYRRAGTPAPGRLPQGLARLEPGVLAICSGCGGGEGYPMSSIQ